MKKILLATMISASMVFAFPSLKSATEATKTATAKVEKAAEAPAAAEAKAADAKAAGNAVG